MGETKEQPEAQKITNKIKNSVHFILQTFNPVGSDPRI
jgi:hypothetical protein